MRTPFWQARFYDFNVWTTKKRVEKLRYMHRNPVKRGLVNSPEEWRWSSYRFYLLGEAGPVRVNEGWEKISFERQQRDRPALRRHFLFPPFAKRAKDGAPTVFLVSTGSKRQNSHTRPSLFHSGPRTRVPRPCAFCKGG